MSGLEPLAALGLACNIMQLISFCGETLTICKNAYAGKSPDENLENVARSLLSVSGQVQGQCRGWKKPSKQQLALQEIATQCAVSARALEDEIAFIGANQKKGDLLAALKVAAKTNWRKRRLERLEKSLTDYQRSMETHLLQRTCSQVEAMKIEQSAAFKNLELDLQAFISHFAAGRTKLQDLLNKEALLIKSHVTAETSRIEASIYKHTHEEVSVAEISIKNHITNTLGQSQEKSRELRDAQIFDARRQKLLDSFEFYGMYERRNMISEAHKDTFQWIFPEDIAVVDSTDLNKDNDKTRQDGEDTRDEVSDAGSTASWETSSSGFDYETWYPRVRNPKWNSFSDWLRSDSSIYWISGKPGSGKSTLVNFLISSPQTRVALDSWRTGVDFLSHFFWRPGSMLQQNLKGFYCVLLHQAFAQCPELHTSVFDDKGLTEMSAADWSLQTLKRLFWQALSHYPRSICLFIDGLDEAHQDEQTDLLTTIFELCSLPNVKVCVSSRREQRFVLRLDALQQLALQDLTERDMQKFAASQMRILLEGQKVASSVQETIQAQLVEKAEGVFLWVIIAVKSLRRGFENGDTLDILLSRLRTLPRELSDLYKDMWSRMRDDHDVYARSAAKRFNLVITQQIVVDLVAQDARFGGGHIERLSGLSLLFATLALDRAALHSIITKKDKIGSYECVELIEKAKVTEKTIRSHCAGLLDVVSQPRRPQIGPCKRKWRAVVNKTVRFVHRTAYDFMVSSEEGLKLRLQDEESQDERILVICKTMVALIACLGWDTHNDVAFGGDIHTILQALSQIRDESLRDDINEFLGYFWRCYERQVALSTAVWTPHFLAFTFFPYYRDFTLRAIEQSPDPPALATSVLLSLCSGALPWESLVVNGMAAVKPSLQLLLALGANPNARVHDHSIYRTNAFNDGSFRGGTAVAELLKNMFRFWVAARDEWIAHLDCLLPPLLTESSSLYERVTLIFPYGSRLHMPNDPRCHARVSENLSRGFIMQANLAYLLGQIQQHSPGFDILADRASARSSCEEKIPLPHVSFVVFASKDVGNGDNGAATVAHKVRSNDELGELLTRFNATWWTFDNKHHSNKDLLDYVGLIAGQVEERDAWTFQDALDYMAKQDRLRSSDDHDVCERRPDCV